MALDTHTIIAITQNKKKSPTGNARNKNNKPNYIHLQLRRNENVQKIQNKYVGMFPNE